MEASSRTRRLDGVAVERNIRAAAGRQRGSRMVMSLLGEKRAAVLLRQARATPCRPSQFTHRVGAPEYVGMLCPW